MISGVGDSLAVSVKGFQFPIDRSGLFPVISFSYFAFDHPCPYGDCRTSPDLVQHDIKIIFDPANNGPDPNAVANSMKRYTLNTLVYGPLQQLKNKTVWYFCGSSPSGAIENWMETGATKGAIGGAIAGGGAAGVVSFGFGGAPGAVVGGFLGGVAGAGGGVLFGGMAAATCSAAGVYGSGS
jgi:hypothetical protein